MAHPRLIVNGDDFGISEEVNEAIVQAYREGILTSCSLMAGEEAFDHAVALARRNPGLGVGVHLVTAVDRSVLPHSEIPTLVDEDGRFPSNPVRAGLRYAFSARARAELRAELEAQLRRFEETGLPCSHIDSHLHMHVHPAILSMAIELAERHGIRRMRLPRDSLVQALRYGRGGVAASVVQAPIFAVLSGSMERRLAARGIAHASRVYGLYQTGRMSETYLLSVLERLGEGTSEVYCHPALPSGDEAGRSPGRRQQLRELEMLTSPAVKRRIDDLGITLVSYHALEAVA